MHRIQREVVSDYTNVWKLTTILATLVAVLAVAVYAFQQRTPIIEALTGHKLFMNPAVSKNPYPGKETGTELMKFVDTHDGVLGISVAKVDFELNTRITTWRYFKEPTVEKSWQTTQGKPLELFSGDTVSNARVVSLINGQFTCSPTNETTAGKVHPVMLNFSATTCSIAIPPGYGDFIGWINFYLTTTPTFNQLESLEKQATVISRTMYERDIMKKSFTNGGSNG